MQSLETDTLEDAHNRVRLEAMHYANTGRGKQFLLDAVNRLIEMKDQKDQKDQKGQVTR